MSQHNFRFTNGIYVTNEDKWISLESSLIISKSFDLEFTFSDYDDWFEIILKHCPTFLYIMNYQEWPEEVQRMLCIFIGRLIYNSGELDNWDVIPYLFGTSGSGKSLILLNIVRPISNQLILNEYINKFIIDHKSIGVIGIIASNEEPLQSPNIQLFTFNKTVQLHDTNFALKLKEELPWIIQACNKGYLKKITDNMIASRKMALAEQSKLSTGINNLITLNNEIEKMKINVETKLGKNM
jgi:hypothetical protein